MREVTNITIEDGVLTTPTLRTSYRDDLGIHRGAVIIKGGTINLTGITYNDGTLGYYASFMLPYSTNVLEMSGGTININGVTTANAGQPGYRFGMLLNCSANNINITGGTININVAGNDVYLNSTAPLYNLNVLNAANNIEVRNYAGRPVPPNAGYPNLPPVTPQPLVVLNNFTLQNNKGFNNTANVDLRISGNFIINAGSTYTPGNNITTFNGNGSQLFDAIGPISGNLQNLSLTNSSNLTINNSNPLNPLVVKGNFVIDSGCVFIDNGRILQVQGNITNSGTHFKPVSGAGSIQLTGAAVQTISGNGNGLFNNLTINKTGGSVGLTANQTITGDLRLAGAGTAAIPSRLNIGQYNLKFAVTGDIYSDLAPGVSKNFNENRMIQTGGLMSDGGVSKTYSSTTGFLYPFGFLSGATYYYMPADIRFSANPAQYGSVTSRPVNARHPLMQSPNSLSTYWKTTSTGFAGIPSGSVVHRYYHDKAHLTNFFVSGTETAYVPGVYYGGSTWSVINNINNVNEGTNEVLYDTSFTANGDYSAGEPASFTSIPVLYSVANGNWNNANSWSDTPGGTNHPGIPGSNTIVYIVDNHTITATVASFAGSLFIDLGSVLDLGNTQGHNFASLPDKSVAGRGKLRIASDNYFPQGDFGDFIGENGGTVEYYTTGSNITLPTNSSVTNITLDHYYNLTLSPANGTTIFLPSGNLHIYNDMDESGTGTGQVYTNTASPRVINVSNDFNVVSGIFEVRNTNFQIIKVFGNFNVDGTFRVQNSAGVDHILELYGNLTGTGTFTANNGTGRILTYFKGFNNTVITGALKGFYSLEVDKGTSQIPVLDVTANISTAFDPALSLKNGTFRYSGPGILNISGTSGFSIPATGCLSVTNGTVNIVTANNGNDLLLAGKLEMLGGTLNIGTQANNIDNDIEYPAEGYPAIDIQGGTLNVNGQIRRGVLINEGALNYVQSGGTVNIYGDNQAIEKAKFEVCNANSSFSMSNGVINIYRGGADPTFGDLYLHPTLSIVTGGTINIGPVAGMGNNNYRIDATCNLHNLSVNGIAGNTATVNLMVNPLILTGSLTINSNSSLITNNINVSVAGNFTNNGTYNAGTNTTIFNGNNAQIGSFGAATTFRKLIIDKAVGSTITFSTTGAIQPIISDSLVINSGTLSTLSPLNIIARGNIINNGIHTGTGSLIIQGTTNQIISGNGSGQFGNINLTNGASNGATLKSDISVNGILTLTTGYFYINDYLLTLGSAASIGGSPGVSANHNWIITNGVLSDAGVKKIYPGVSPSNFTFPVGVFGKYTPVYYNVVFASASPGSITIKPINGKIPSLTNDGLNNELQYYWNVTSTPFGGMTGVTQIYSYALSDVLGTEANYVGARYYANAWTNLGQAGVINTATHTITVNQNYIDGEYTCGEPGNFGLKPVYYSYDLAPDIDDPLLGADWNLSTTWATGSHNGVPAVTPPDGNPIIIKSGHRINVSNNDRYAYSVQNDGILDLYSTNGHSFGHFNGQGRVIIWDSPAGQYVFPGGDFTGFMNTTGSTVEYYGGTGTLISSISSTIRTYQNLEFKGPFSKYMAAVNITVRGNFLIADSKLDNSVYNKNISISGNWVDNVTNGYNPGNGLVSFEGTMAQNITTTDPEHFYNLRISNSSNLGLTLTGKAAIANHLYLNNGNINTTDVNLLTITNSSLNAVTGGSYTSFVDGPLNKYILTGQSFDFPVGNINPTFISKPVRFGNIQLSGVSSTNYWSAKYVNEDPNGIYNSSSLLSPLTRVSDNEYWVVSRPAGNTANVKIRWDDQSSIASVNTTRVAEWTTSNQWEEKGSLTTGSISSGSVSTTVPVVTDNYVFTLGVSGVTARINSVNPTTICNNGDVVTVSVTLTGTPAWTLSYTAGGNPFVQSGIGSGTYNIQLTGADLGGPGTRNIQLTAVSDITGPGTVDAAIYPVTVLPTNIPDIQGTFTVGAGELRNFLTANNAGSTYAWSWQGASGGSIATPAANGTDITITTPGTFPSTYQLQVIETSSNGCAAQDVQAITVVNAPSPTISPNGANQCLNNVVTYSTPIVGAHTYAWTVVGGTPVNGNGNSITVTWNTMGNGSVSVIENNLGITGTDTVNVVVDPQPSVGLVVTGPVSVCYDYIATINVAGSQAGFNYQLRDGSIPIGSAIAGTGGNIGLSSLQITAPTTFNVLAYNNGCSSQLTQTVAVGVSDPAAPTGFASQTFCAITNPQVGNLSATGSNIQWYAASSGGAPLLPTVLLTDATSYYASQTVSGCESRTRLAVAVTLSSVAAPTVGAITQPTCAVATGSVVLSGLPAGNWTINPGAINGNTVSTTISGLATGTYNFTVTNSVGCTSLASANVGINPQPATPVAPTVGAITQPTCAVATGSVVLSGLPAGNWTINPGAINGNTVSTTISGLATGTYNFTVTNSVGCTSLASANVGINPQPSTPVAPTVGAITQPTCAVATGGVVLSGLPAGNWTINPGAINGNTVSTTVSGLATGTYNFTVTNSVGCTSLASANVGINPQPATPVAPTVGAITQPTCAVATGSVVLSGLPAGNWIINPGAINGNTVSTTVSGLATGTYNFTVTNSVGCTSLASANVGINPQPSTPVAPTVGAITQPTCAVATGSVVLSGLPAGNWTINPGAINGNTVSTTISGLATGTYNFTVTNSVGCTSLASANVGINPQPATPAAPTVGAITQPTCAVATGSVVLSGLPAGNWTINPGAINGNTVSTTISGLATGTYNFTVTNSVGCTSLASANVDINPQPTTPAAPTVGAITQPTCAVATGSVVLSGLPAGNWTINPGAINGNTVSTTISGLGTGTYNFTVTNSVGCTSLASANVGINPQPATPVAPTVGAITQPTCAVATGSVVLSGLPAGNWTINPGAINGNTVSTTVSGLGTGTYNFTVTNSVGCTSLASANVDINPQPATPVAPTVGAITQPTCAVATGSVVLSGLPAGNWIINPGAINGNTVSTTISGLATGTYNFTVTNSVGCTSLASANVGINPQPATPVAPTVGAITQPTCAVATGSVVLSGLPAGNWTINPGAINGNTVSTTISGLATGTYNFTVTNSVGCTSLASANVDINPQPATPVAPTVGAITQPTCAVATGSVVLSGLPAGNWTINPGAINGNTVSTTVSGLATGTYNFTVTNSVGCTSLATANVDINPQPATPAAPTVGAITQPTCAVATGSVVLSGLPAGNWIINPGAINGNTVSTTVSGLATGTYNFTVTNSVGCTSLASANVEINPQPATPVAPTVGAITQPTCAVATGSVVLSGLPAGNWTINPGAINGNTVSTTISGLATGTYNFTVTNSVGCTSLASANVGINPQPATPVAPTVGAITQPTCAVATGSVVLSGLPAGNWTINPGAINGNTVSTTISGLGTGTYNFTVTNSVGCTSLASANVDINPQPSTPVAPTVGAITQPTCAVATGSVVLSGLPAGNWTINPGAINGNTVSTTISGLATGTYNFTVTNSVGCTSLASANVDINPQPSTPVAPTVGAITQPTCAVATGSVVLSGLPAGNWTINPGAINGNTVSTTISGLATGTYNFTVTNSVGCTSLASANVGINPQPATPAAPTVGAITQPTCAVATGSVVLSGLPAGNWTINPGAINGNTVSTTISGLATGTYNFTVTNSVGCTSLASANVGINPQPATPAAPTVGAITQPTCAVATGSVVLSGLPAGNWTINPGAINGNTVSTTISGLATGTYNFTVTNSVGCTSLASANVGINPRSEVIS